MIWVSEAENQNARMNDEFLCQSYTDKELMDKICF